MPAHLTKTRPLRVANDRHSPSYGSHLRLDRTRFGALLVLMALAWWALPPLLKSQIESRGCAALGS